MERKAAMGVQSEIKGMTVFNQNKVDFTKQQMFFGQPLGIQRYDVNKYPVFYKLTQEQLGAFWRPEEFPLQKDRADYQKLRPEQKHIFTSNLKYQIMLDSVQGRGPGSAFIPYCSLPELESAMIAWEFMEMVHSYSYTYIIKNVYADPTEVFDTIIDDERILERASSVTESYDDFINSAQRYGSSELWKFKNEGVSLGKDELYEVKRKLYRAIMNVNILEGIRFYVSFACSFAFGELQLMEGSAKIIQKISIDEACFVKGTEVLTPTGWKKFEDLDKTELVAQYNKNGSIDFVAPLHYTRKHYKGKVYQFRNKLGHFNQIVTPDHRIIWRDSKTKEINENLAEDFSPQCNKHYIATGIKNEGRDELSYEERFKIALQADGNICNKELRNGKFNGCNIAKFSLTKERKRTRFEGLLDKLKYKYTTKITDEEAGEIEYTVWVPIDQSITKDFSWVNLNDVSGKWCQEFLKELSHWDGHLAHGDYSSIYYSTVNSDVADTVQGITALSGWRCYRGIQVDNRKESYKDVHRLYILPSKDFYCCGPSKNKIELDYDDEVFCVTVPSGMLVVRYDNSVVISGNCHLNLTQNIITKWKKGDDPDMVKIAAEEEAWSYAMFDRAVNEEKKWAKYLFQYGSMIGLNDQLLYNYIEWNANRRMKAIGFSPVYDIAVSADPLPWMSKWLNSRNIQVAPQEENITSYIVGGINQDMKPDAFSGFKL
jgi:ribonucleoside-diphosphate reductase beta chain